MIPAGKPITSGFVVVQKGTAELMGINHPRWGSMLLFFDTEEGAEKALAEAGRDKGEALPVAVLSASLHNDQREVGLAVLEPLARASEVLRNVDPVLAGEVQTMFAALAAVLHGALAK